jgi:hypothetical protein
MDCINLAHDRGKIRSVVNTAMNLGVSQNAPNFFVS